MHSCISSLKNAQMCLVLLGLVSSARAASVVRRCLLELHERFFRYEIMAREKMYKKEITLIEVHH